MKSKTTRSLFDAVAGPTVLLLLLAFTASPAFAKDAEQVDSADVKKTTGDSAAETSEPSLDDLLKLNDDKKPELKKPDSATNIPDIKPQAKLSDAQASNAFAQAVEQMNEAAARLRKLQDAGVQTQRIQESVLRHLDEVLAHAQQQQQKSKGKPGSSSKKPKQETGSSKNQQKQGSKPQGNQPKGKNQSSNPSKGKFSPGNASEPTVKGNIEETRVEWGNLPQRLRDELDQSLGEKFSPIYKKLTEAYYRRLAEEGNK